MKKFLVYVLTHFKVQPSHPEESDPGWEIRWVFFNIAFMKKRNPDHIDKTEGKK